MNHTPGKQKAFSLHPILLVLLAFAVVIAGALWLINSQNIALSWCFVLLMLAAFTFVCGHVVTGRWLGALIDERNVMSLSRFQIILWTLLVLSAYLVAALNNISLGIPDPLKIEMQKELWWLMGISTATLVGSPLILSDKANKVSDTAEVSNTFELLKKQGDEESTLGTMGHIVVNTDIAKARWTDLFTGEEVGNAAHLDVARLQMFFFTLITALAYAALLWNKFYGDAAKAISDFPALSSSMIALIGISHAGYLTAKAVPHSQTGIGQPAQQIAPEVADEHPPVG